MLVLVSADHIWNGAALNLKKTVASSTWEAKYTAAYHASRHINILRQLLRDIGQEQRGPAILYLDNLGAIQTAKTPRLTPKSKQIDVHCHYLKEQVALKNIQQTHTLSDQNSTDCLTKPLKWIKFAQATSQLKLTSISP